MKFQPGHSGNPGGRPKIVLPDGRSLQDLAREHTVDAVNALVSVMTNDEAPPAAIVGAASAILDRGWGRPKGELDVGERLGNILEDVLSRVDGRTRLIEPPRLISNG